MNTLCKLSLAATLLIFTTLAVTFIAKKTNSTIPPSSNSQPQYSHSHKQPSAIENIQSAPQPLATATAINVSEPNHGFNQNGSLESEMQKRFEAETRDIFWAEQQEQKLENIFLHDPEFSGIALREASCRTSQCMLSIAITDIEQANQLAGSITKAIESENTFYTVIAAANPHQGVTKLFISREGSSFN